MRLPEYVSLAEVKRVCKELGIRDWTKLKKAEIPLSEAKVIMSKVNADKLKVSPENFRIGLEVELEHGLTFKNYNVTNNHPLLTGMIVMAHFMEMLDYYQRLDVAEIEGDLLKAVAAKNMEKVQKYYKKLITARAELIIAEAEQFKS